MTPAVLVIAGLVLVVACVLAMAWCANHPGFGSATDGAPHFTYLLAGWLWLPMVGGVVLAFSGLVLLCNGVCQ